MTRRGLIGCHQRCVQCINRLAGDPICGSQVAEATEEDGLYLYRHMLLPELQGLVWIGANVSTLSQSLTANVQVSAHDSSVGWCTVLVGAAVLSIQRVGSLVASAARRTSLTAYQTTDAN